MKWEATPIQGVWRIGLDRREDERGFFARSYCEKEFAEHGITEHFSQCNISYNKEQNTLRGMHYQAVEHPESKVVRCIKGAIFDVAIDLRPASSTFKHWYGAQLNADNRDSLYIPPGVAHGFITLSEDAELFYMMGGNYVADAARGVRWNDPCFGINWPCAPKVMSDRDRAYPDFTA